MARRNYSPLEKIILFNLGVSDTGDINNWFLKSYHNEYFIKGLKEAVTFTKKFMDEEVHIVGDYDVDGTAATSILYMGLREYGFKKVTYHIPKRFSEGFGINTSIIDRINSGLIITCDNGIAALDALKKAKEKGISVIVTDHHQPVVNDGKTILPDADYIIDPNALPGSAVFSGYCGAGIAYKFVCELFNFEKNIRYKYLSLAALGTVCDVMELREENYVIVSNGLKTLHNPAFNRSGLNALIKLLGLESRISESDIGFKIGPVINACSRMKDDGAKDAVNLLTFNGNPSAAMEMADKMIATNTERKAADKKAMKNAMEIIEKENLSGLCPLTLYIPDIPEGIIGIIAGRLSEKFRVPSLVFTNITENGNTLFKGSARGYGDYNVKASFDMHPELFVRYGGHAGAAGMTILPQNFDRLTKVLNKDAIDYTRPDSIAADILRIDEKEIPEMLQILQKYAPFGEGNPRPLFCIKFSPYCKRGEYRQVLGTGLKINGRYADAVTFSDIQAFDGINERNPLLITGELEANYYKGREYPRIMIHTFEKL